MPLYKQCGALLPLSLIVIFKVAFPSFKFFERENIGNEISCPFIKIRMSKNRYIHNSHFDSAAFKKGSKIRKRGSETELVLPCYVVQTQ